MALPTSPGASREKLPALRTKRSAGAQSKAISKNTSEGSIEHPGIESKVEYPKQTSKCFDDIRVIGHLEMCVLHHHLRMFMKSGTSIQLDLTMSGNLKTTILPMLVGEINAKMLWHQ